MLKISPLSQIKYVDKVTNTSGFTYEISFTIEKDMRSQIFDFAHDNELKISNLTEETKPLNNYLGT